jgi:hypothetical protein
LDDEDRYRSILAGFIGLVPNVDERSQVTPEWRVLEKRQKEETSTATKAVAPIELQLPRVGTLRIEVASLQPPHKMVTLDFDTAQAAKKARTMLSRDFSIKVA